MLHSSHFSKLSMRRGFTLVELLVTIVIVSVLATIATAGFREVKSRALQVQCKANMRDIGLGLQQHAGDNNGSYPNTAHTASLDRAWIEALRPYLDDFDETRICPADPLGDRRLAAGGTSYVLNSFIFVPRVNAWGDVVGQALNRPARIPNPSQTIVAFVCSDSVGVGPGNDHTHSDRWRSWAAVCSDICPSRFGGGEEATSDEGRSNYLFVDGRIESLTAREIKQRTESGINIAEPPGLDL